MSLQDKVKFVLVETSHPGNLGATARSLANMGFSNLTLVSPFASISDPVAVSRASNATQVLEQASICNTLEEAISDCNLVFATRARSNTLKWREYTPRAAVKEADKVINIDNGKIAIVFGPEKTGLSNEMLELCCSHIVIPTASYSSLNLAQAVQILAYELFLGLGEVEADREKYSSEREVKASSSDTQSMLAALESTMIKLKFLDPEKPKKLMPRIRSIFMRCGLSENEVQMLRGFISSIDKNIERGIDD